PGWTHRTADPDSGLSPAALRPRSCTTACRPPPGLAGYGTPGAPASGENPRGAWVQEMLPALEAPHHRARLPGTALHPRARPGAGDPATSSAPASSGYPP